jgi:hypothetical protein
VSTYDGDRIEKPSYLHLAPLRQGRSARPVQVIGFDTEASDGYPILLQFSEGGGWADADLVEIPSGESALPQFMTWVDKHCRKRNTEYLIFGFNLSYEWTQLFGNLPSELTASNEFEITMEPNTGWGQRWLLRVMNFRRYNMTMTAEESHVRVTVLDGHAFFPGSLAAVAKTVGVEDKEEMDKEFLVNLTRADLSDQTFRRYAAQDAVTTRLIGERVVVMHETFDVRTCISAPHLAARAFRRQFLLSEVALPGGDLEQAGLWSYHGGKNGYYHRGPMSADAWSLDIVSAYPEAMRMLPALEDSVWWRTSTYREGLHALWLVRLDHRRCRYGGLFDHDGRRLRRGVSEVWVTGYELDVMLSYGEARRLDVVDGWVMTGSEGDGAGLATYVDRFFEEKRTSTGITRVTAKLMLNSLYGKFFQKVPIGDVQATEGSIGEGGTTRVWEAQTVPEQPYDYRAGGLYHPPVASLITGFVRAKIHDIEHRHRAIATSTDGCFAENGPDPALIGSDLGMLTADHGHLDIWRERLYRFGEIPSGPVMTTPMKWALHGFRGGEKDLQKIPLEPGSYSYKARHPVTLRESQRMLSGSRYRPGEFALLDFTLDLTGADKDK